MSRRPAFSFYPADWRNNANLRRCGWGARGAWIEVMGLMHDADEYGVLRWPLKEVAHSIGAPLPLLRELARFNVMKGCDVGTSEPCTFTPRHARKALPPVTLLDAQPGPIWFSSRMLKDEYLRTVRGDATRFEVTPDGAPKPAKGDGLSSSSSIPSSNLTLPPSPSAAGPPTEPARWGAAVKAAMSETWPDDARVLMLETGITEVWRADGIDLDLDVLPTVRQLSADKPDHQPPTSLKYFNNAVRRRHSERKAAGAAAMPDDALAAKLATQRLRAWNDAGMWEDHWGPRPKTRPIAKLPEAA